MIFFVWTNQRARLRTSMVLYHWLLSRFFLWLIVMRKSCWGFPGDVYVCYVMYFSVSSPAHASPPFIKQSSLLASQTAGNGSCLCVILRKRTFAIYRIRSSQFVQPVRLASPSSHVRARNDPMKSIFRGHCLTIVPRDWSIYILSTPGGAQLVQARAGGVCWVCSTGLS